MKLLILIFSDTETHADTAKVVNALGIAREFIQAGEEVQIIFDGAGTRWIPRLTDSKNPFHAAFEAVCAAVAGSCAFCSKTFGVEEEVRSAGIPLLSEFSGHPSIHPRVAQGYSLLVF